ncbi:unnamed protein product [Discosporangium mesarthrocarpum]
MISVGTCSNRAKRILQSTMPSQTCSFELDESDIVFGVWHSLATEHRLGPLLDTWGARTNIVLLASTVGVKNSKLFKEEVGSKPHLLNTGVEQDDYFSTLGKAFIGLRLMLEAYPSKKWFVVIGDDNYVLIDNYVRLLSAFDPEKPWAITRMVYTGKFGCKAAGGASIITSRRMTEALAPYLEPWFREIYERSEGDVRKASMEDKYHDIAFQRLVEHHNYSWVHLPQLMHEPPGYYFLNKKNTQSSVQSSPPPRPGLFHYVPGMYMHYLHFLTSGACVCGVGGQARGRVLKNVAVGIYSTSRRLSKLDEMSVLHSWGKDIPHVLLRESTSAAVQGAWGWIRGGELGGVAGIGHLLELRKNFPHAKWLVMVPVDHFVVTANLAVRVVQLESRKHGEQVLITGRDGGGRAGGWGFNPSGGLLLGAGLVDMLLRGTEDPGDGGDRVWEADDEGVLGRAMRVAPASVFEDDGFLARLPLFSAGERGETERRVRAWVGTDEGVRVLPSSDLLCPATFPMAPDVADLKPEFTLSESGSVLRLTEYLLTSRPPQECIAEWVGK